MKSVMQHRFSNLPNVDIPRSTFNRSHGVKTTFDAGYLIPILVDEALPGDTFSCHLNGFARIATPIYPIMDNLIMETFFFSVPNRLVWDNWPRFCGERKDPSDTIDYTIPQVSYTNEDNETIYDYMGLPTKVANALSVSALPLRAYNLIWNEWFRAEALQDQVTVNTNDGPDPSTDYTLLRRAKRHDYFTSALPWLQRGDAVQLSLGSSAPVLGIGTATPQSSTSQANFAETSASAQKTVTGWHSATTGFVIEEDASNIGYPDIITDLSKATASTVNELRQAIQVQRILEKDARSGTRYTEIIQSHFGVTSPDARLQRPEYLGGGSSPVQIKPIARTDSAPGELGAMGIAGFTGHGFVKSFTEHCTIIGLVNVRADLTYQEGIDRMWSRSTRYDFYWPTLSHLGEQSILNKEIYADGSTNDEGVFGYQERYAEYRYKPSKITGKFRSNDAASLDAWHLGIEFGSLPTLGNSFIQENPPLDRCIATPTEPHFIFDSYCQMMCTRPMPIYSIPGLVDHF